MTTARKKLESGSLSRKAQLQLQGLGDVDVDEFRVHLKNAAGIKVEDRLLSADLTRSIDGSSSIAVSLIDDDRAILRSGYLSQRSDVNVDGLWFRLSQVRGDTASNRLDLTFKDRAVAILQTYDKKMGPISRTQMTRAQFILRMIKQVTEINIPVFIPELLTVQQVEVDTSADTPRTPASDQQAIPTDTSYLSGTTDFGGGTRPQPPSGFVPGSSDFPTNPSTAVEVAALLTIKGSPATVEQKNNATTILRAGKANKARRKVLVAAIMTAIQESSIRNLSYAQSPGNHRGVFQQDPRYWPASGDVATDADGFFKVIVGIDRDHPNLTLVDLIERTQNSGNPNAYAPHRVEAEHFVTAFGEPGGDNSIVSAGTTNAQHLAGGNDYFFFRGVPPQSGSSLWKAEDSWTCIQRLAGDVQWRAYFNAGKFYYVTEDWLFKSTPAMTITPDTNGVLNIVFDYDQGKKNAQITLTALMKRWAAPPGTVVVLRGMGPVNGRWLVTDASRSLFSETGTITLKKPLPKLPEPTTNVLQNATSVYTAPTESTDQGQTFRTVSNLVQPIPAGLDNGHGPVHPTSGLDGYPAIDFFANPGVAVVAMENGVIERFSGCDPTLGPVSDSTTCTPKGLAGAGGPLGLTIYLKGESGTDYFITHLGSRLVAVGQRVAAGQQIGTVADYDKWGRRSHTHVGVHGGSVTIEELGSAGQAAAQ